MTKDEYRWHMRKYSRETATSSAPAEVSHPDYQAMREAGKEIIPYLFQDMLDPDWYCDACYGYGYEFVPEWQKEIFPPRSTGNACTKCGGKGDICSWACMILLFDATGDDAPKVEDWMRGKGDVLIKLWRKWGEQRGYLPPTLDETPTTKPSILGKIRRTILSVLFSTNRVE